MISSIQGLLWLLDSTQFSAISVQVFTWLQYASKYEASFHPAASSIFLQFPWTCNWSESGNAIPDLTIKTWGAKTTRKKKAIIVLIMGNDFSYQINEVLGSGHIRICGAAIGSCQYFYHYDTQTKYIKLVCDFPLIYKLWWRVSAEIYLKHHIVSKNDV